MSKVRKSRGNTFLFIKFSGSTGAFSATDKFAEVKSANFSSSAGTIDVTNWDSGDWQEVVPNISSGSIPVTCNLIVDSTLIPQITAANGGAQVSYLLVYGDLPATGAKNLCIQGKARVMNLGFNAGDSQELAFTLTVDGAPAFSQAATAYPTVV